ncbi:MAG: type 1 glutamine amidotransferase [Terriglobales bacterium]
MWAILQHVAWETPGIILPELKAHGIQPRIFRMDRGETLPRADQLEGLVVMGGTMGVYEAERFPFLAQEQELLRACAMRGTPVLGICLGAQLLAAALGAPVTQGPAMEVGEGEVMLTEAGRHDPVLGAGGAATLPVVHWHRDTFPLPPGATLLASTPLYAQPAFRVGKHAYGLQFHPEVDAELAAAWSEHGMSLSPAHVQRVEAAGRALVARFLNLSAARRPAPPRGRNESAGGRSPGARA